MAKSGLFSLPLVIFRRNHLNPAKGPMAKRVFRTYGVDDGWWACTRGWVKTGK